MKKEEIETFIKRYNLGNLIPKVKWKYNSSSKTLHTRGVADQNDSFVVDVIMHDFTDLGDSDVTLCIGDTEKVIGMMTPFVGEDITLSLNKNEEKVMGLTMSDADCESYCTMADAAAISAVPKNINLLIDFQVEVPITEDFIDKFLKAKAALKEVMFFSIGMNQKNVFEVVLGHTTINSNRIRLTPTTDPIKNSIDTALSFPIKNIAEVLKANSDIEGGLMSINKNGIIRLFFSNEKYTCTYYQFAVKKM